MSSQKARPARFDPNTGWTISLTAGKVSRISEEDIDLSSMLWSFSSGYAIRGKGPGRLWLHKLVAARMGLFPEPGVELDHIDGDSLNNRRDNLRLCTHLQNSFNRRLRTDNRSGEKGVDWDLSRGRWRAQIGFKGARITRFFKTFESAVVWVRNKRVELHADFHRHK